MAAYALRTLRDFMELEKVTTLKAVEACTLCADSCHKTQDCPIMSMMESGMDQLQVTNWVNKMNNPYSNMYNPKWRNYPNFSWKID